MCLLLTSFEDTYLDVRGADVHQCGYIRSHFGAQLPHWSIRQFLIAVSRCIFLRNRIN